MQFKPECIGCLMERELEKIKNFKDEEKKLAFIKDVCAEIVNAPRGVAAPYLVSRMGRAFYKRFGERDDYEEIKKESNDYALKRLCGVRNAVEKSADPLLSALIYARLGNYIDFGALHGRVDMQELDLMLENALLSEKPDEKEYKNLLRDLEKGKELLYITDNAGEIVFDMLFIEKIKERFKNLNITAAVRGAPVLNDATEKDASYIGLNKICRVIGSGSDISGTQISEIGDELKNALSLSDVVIAKGQGNFETMLGCGYNVYYLFLCKCELFVKAFCVPRFTGVTVNEKRAPESLKAL